MSSKLLKEKIKARMMQNAARLWGAEGSDIEVDFDPLVAVLIEGCVNEIEKINNEIENTHARVINRLIQLLTPDMLTGYLPAHAIMHARPSEATYTVRPELQLYFAKKTHNGANPKIENSKDVFFSPAFEFKLTNGALRYSVFHEAIYEAQNAYQKNLIAEGENRLEHGILWIGLELTSPIYDPDGLSFYFDLKNNPERNVFINLLPYTKWSVDGVPLRIETGLPVVEDAKVNELQDEFDGNRRFVAETLAFYNGQFITVRCSSNTAFDISKNKLPYPESFEQVFLKKDLQKLSNKCVWVKIEFPSQVSVQMLSDMICSMNCFPVVNRKLNEFTFRLAQNLNIVPLSTVDYFFSIREVQASDGTPYSNSPAGSTRNAEGGSYILRQGGIERFDSRDATEMLNYLLDLLRDESAAFTMLGNEFISSNLRQLSQLLALLEQRIEENGNIKESSYYLLVSPGKEAENIIVSFWSTTGEFANGIKAGSKFELYGGGDIQSNSIMLMTTTKAGRGKLGDLERMVAFRSSLVSRGRVVTANDIRMFCFFELGKEIEEVKVTKGFMSSDQPKTGLIQTIDVRLKIAKNNQSAPNEWKNICENLSKKLMDKSPGLTPIRVMVGDKSSKSLPIN